MPTDILEKLELIIDLQEKEQPFIDDDSTAKEAAAEIRRLREELGELNDVFDAMWDADQRAIRQWQKDNIGLGPKVWPDRAKLTTWLLDRVEEYRKQVEELKEALGTGPGVERKEEGR